MPDVEIYTQPWCPFCERAMHILTTKGVEFHEIDAPDGSAARAEAQRALGRTHHPCRRSSSMAEHIGGCDDLLGAGSRRKTGPAAGVDMKYAGTPLRGRSAMCRVWLLI